MYTDYGIIVIKPDGVKKGVDIVCECVMQSMNVRILAKKNLILSVSDIKNYFCYKFQDYVEYMTSGMVCAYLLELSNADIDEAIYFIKDTVRKKFSVDGRCLKNFIHGAHCGTEYFRQRKLFFEEYEKKEYSSYADMLVVLEGLKKIDIKHYIKDLEQGGIKEYILCCGYDKLINSKETIYEFVKKEDIIASIHKMEVNGKKVRVLVYGKVHVLQDLIKKGEEAVLTDKEHSLVRAIDLENLFIDELYKMKPRSIEEFQIRIKELYCVLQKFTYSLSEKGVNIDAMVVNRADLPVDEAEVRYELALEAKLIPIIGSYANNAIGLFGCGPNKFKKLIDLLA